MRGYLNRKILGLILILSAVAAYANATTLPATINSNTTLTKANSPYRAVADVTVAAGVTLTVEAGVEIRFGRNCGLYVRGRVLMLGREDDKIRILPDTGVSSWDVISIVSNSGNSEFSYVTITGATTGDNSDRDRAAITGYYNQEIRLDHVEIRNVEACVYLNRSTERCYFTNCVFEANHSGSMMALVECDVVIDQNEFIGNNFENSDAIDFDKVEAMITNNVIYGMTGGDSDGIDLGSASEVTLIGNVIYNCNDSGIEAEEYSVITASRNVIYDCGIGVTIKEDAEGVLINNTFYKINLCFSAYSETGSNNHGGKITAKNNIIASTDALYSSRHNSTLTFSYNLHDSGTLPGTGNLVGDPMFVQPSVHNFHLQTGSPAIDHGDPSSPPDEDGTRADIGAFAYYQQPLPKIIISEIHFRPLINGFEDMDQEFIEIYNSDSYTVDLSGYRFSSGIEFTFPAEARLEPASYILVVRDRSYYSSSVQKYEWSSGNLSNTGELIEIRNTSDQIVVAITYSSGSVWPRLPGTLNLTIQLKALNLEYKTPASWRTSYVSGGTPGISNSRAMITQLYVNELVSRYGTAYPDEHGLYSDWIELYNGSNYDIDLGGLYLTDSYSDLGQAKIPEGYPDSTFIRSRSYFVFHADLLANLGINHVDFQLASAGEQVALSQLMGQDFQILDSVTYPLLGLDVSYGRTSDGAGSWTTFTTPTPGKANSGSGFIHEFAGESGDITFSVFPNPASGHFHISLETSVTTSIQLKIIDSQGRVLAKYSDAPLLVPGGQVLTWDLTAEGEIVAPGIYYLLLSTRKEVLTRKIVILEKN